MLLLTRLIPCTTELVLHGQHGTVSDNSRKWSTDIVWIVAQKQHKVMGTEHTTRRCDLDLLLL